MDPYFEKHVQRLRSRLDPEKQIKSLAQWMCQKTYIKGKKFSFDRFPFQKTIIEDTAKSVSVRKCAQVGVSEIFSRQVIGICSMYEEANCIYIMPTATDAQRFCATRVNPIIDSSPDLRDSIHRDTDSVTTKRFVGTNSFLFAIGASRIGQTISIPATGGIFGDEVDFIPDPAVFSSFNSRLQAAGELGYKRMYSTPTVEGWGISRFFDESKRFIPLHKCLKCNHEWQVSYHNDVVLPGFNGDLREINYLNKQILLKLPVKDAFVACPRCHNPVDLTVWRFVVENPDEGYDEHGYQITPFINSLERPVWKLIKESTEHTSFKNFSNNVLGLPASDSTTGISREEVDLMFTNDVRFPETPPWAVAGIDMGGSCPVLVGYMSPNEELRVYHAEAVPLHEMRTRIPQIFGKYRVIGSVFDAMPYSDLIIQLQSMIPSSWACTFTSSKGVELFQVREREDDPERATYGIRAISAKRDLLLDIVAQMCREGKITFGPGCFDLKETLIKHLTSMKRIEIVDRQDESQFRWTKTDGIDHYLFSLAFLLLATYIKGYGGGGVQMPMIAAKMKIKSPI
jgi:hypothetical protein